MTEVRIYTGRDSSVSSDPDPVTVPSRHDGGPARIDVEGAWHPRICPHRLQRRCGLKALVWEEPGGRAWVAYNDPHYIVRRHMLPGTLAANLAAVAPIIERAAQE